MRPTVMALALLSFSVACTHGDMFEPPSICEGILADIYDFGTVTLDAPKVTLALESAEFYDCDLSEARWGWS